VANVIGSGIARTIVDADGDPVNVSDAGNLMVDIGAASISGDLSVALTTADQVSVFGNTDAAGTGTAKALLTDAAGNLQIDVIESALPAGAATSGNQLAAGHTIDCNASYVKLKAEDGTALTDGTNSGMLDVSIHASDGSPFTDTAGKMNIQIGGDSSGGVEVVQDTPADLTATVTQASFARTKAIAGTVDMGTQVSVGSSTTEIADALGDRMAIIIVNDSDETIYIMLGNDAIMNRGIRLNANGGSFATEMYQGVINGICASGSRNVTVTEISP
jgi:hypothetical protein